MPTTTRTPARTSSPMAKTLRLPKWAQYEYGVPGSPDGFTAKELATLRRIFVALRGRRARETNMSIVTGDREPDGTGVSTAVIETMDVGNRQIVGQTHYERPAWHGRIVSMPTGDLPAPAATAKDEFPDWARFEYGTPGDAEQLTASELATLRRLFRAIRSRRPRDSRLSLILSTNPDGSASVDILESEFIGRKFRTYSTSYDPPARTAAVKSA